MNEKVNSFAGKSDAASTSETTLGKAAEAASGRIRITAVKALQPKQGATLIKIIVHCHAELDVVSAIKVAAAVEPIQPLFFEDPLAPAYSEAWEALRRSTRIPILTGENIELPENAMPFILHQTVDCLQPDLINCGGITGAKIMADIAALYRMPICLHNVSGYALNLASQQWSAAVFNCPMMECTRNADIAPEAAGNLPDIHDGKMKVSRLPGLGIELDRDYLKVNRADGEPWWGE